MWQGGDGVRFQYLSNLVNAQVEGHRGIPAVNNVYGVFSLTDSQGSVEFKSVNSSLAFPTVYDEAWQIDRASGSVAWQRLDNAFVVTGDNLALKQKNATVQGSFRLEQPFDTGVGVNQLMLDINAQHVSKDDGLAFVPPNILSESLSNWLSQSLGKGEAENVNLLLRTGLIAGEVSPFLRLSIDSSLEQLEFDPSWPPAKDIQGNVLVTEDRVSVTVNNANFSGLPVKDIQVNVPFKGSEANRVAVQGRVRNQASLIAQALSKTPLQDSVLEPFKDWDIGGELSGEFNLSVPLVKGEQPTVGLELVFSENSVVVSQAQLPIKVLNGRLNFGSDKGVYDTEFELETLGGTSSLVLTSQVDEAEHFILDGVIKGTINSKQVAEWRNAPQPLISRLEGLTTFTGNLAIGRSKLGQVDLDLSTDLVGVKLAMPSPIAKLTDVSVPTDIHIKALNEELLLEVQAKEWLYGEILVSDSQIQGGSVSLLKPLPVDQEIQKGLSFYGQLEEFDWRTWQPIIDDFKVSSSENTDNASDSSIPTNLPEWIRSMDVLVDVLPVNEKNQFNNVKISYTRAKDGHPFTVASDELNAVLNQTDAGPELHIHYLNWLTADKENTAVESNRENEIQPSLIPSMAVKVDQVYIDNRPYGDWSAVIESQGNIVRIKNISTQLPKGQFVGQIFWQGGSRQNVEMTLKAEGENARELTKKFSPSPFLSSNRYQMDVLLSWENSLLSFDRPSLSGRINFNVQKGNFNQVDQLPPFLRLLGIFNVDAFAKRLTFDFSDLYEPGMPFDRFSGDLSIAKGQLKTVEPLKVISPTAEIALQGNANLIDETLNERLTATIPISSTLPVAGLLLATPQIAGLLYITDKLIGDQLSKVTSIQYKIEGPFSEPKVTPVQYSPIR